MTEALDAMVKAMVKAISEQVAVDHFHLYGPDSNVQFMVEGVVDLEKVARAGLEAIRDPGDMVGLALSELPGGYRPGSHSARQIWQAKIDKILEPAAT